MTVIKHATAINTKVNIFCFLKEGREEPALTPSLDSKSMIWALVLRTNLQEAKQESQILVRIHDAQFEVHYSFLPGSVYQGHVDKINRFVLWDAGMSPHGLWLWTSFEK